MIMYAVLSSGGKQYRVEAGTTLTLERIEGEEGASVVFDRVLMIADGDEVTVGTPVVPGASVSGTVLGETLGPKLVIFKFKQKVKYRRRTGHRQHLTRVRIDAIHPTAQKAAAKPKAEAMEEQAEPAAEKTARSRATRARAVKAQPEAPVAEAPVAEAAEEQPKPRARRAAKPKVQE
jgi:large subunit ribosomal protein L21